MYLMSMENNGDVNTAIVQKMTILSGIKGFLMWTMTDNS